MIGKTLCFVFQLTEGQNFLEFTLVYGNYFTFLFFMQRNRSLPVRLKRVTAWESDKMT